MLYHLYRRWVKLCIVWISCICFVLSTSYAVQSVHAQQGDALVPLAGNVAPEVSYAHPLGPLQVEVGQNFIINVALGTNHQEQLKGLMKALYNPKNPRYHHWLPTGQFAARFGPTSTQINLVIRFLIYAGLTPIPSNSSAFTIKAQGPLDKVEAAFHVKLKTYRASNGQTFFSNDTDPLIPTNLSGTIIGILGLNDIPVPVPHPIATTTQPLRGPFNSGFTPSQMASIYNVDPIYNKLHARGEGVTLGLFELSDYTPGDIAVYEQAYGLPHVPIFNVPVDGGPTSSVGAGEVALDIQAQIALAPGAQRILVYQGPFKEDEFAPVALQMAAENRADVISNSWFLCETQDQRPSPIELLEYTAYEQMAAQGQSAFVASGDEGAFGCSSEKGDWELKVQDPGSQPFVTAVGGTSFGNFKPDPITDPHPQYPVGQEHVWNDGCVRFHCSISDGTGATGGGVSRLWKRPKYQIGPGVYEPGFSRSGSYCQQAAGVPCREVPDVSLVATNFATYCTDPIACQGVGWAPGIGTSLSAPLWSAITALADQVHRARLGLLNPILYRFNNPQGYRTVFHDMIGGSNGHYPVIPFYDMATGLGSINAYNLVRTISLACIKRIFVGCRI